jgi:predicted nucleic acid-binding Zn ribbon protein
VVKLKMANECSQLSFDLIPPGCLECGAPIESGKEFCCPKHYNTYKARTYRSNYHKTWARVNRHGMPVLGYPDKLCEVCGVAFTPRNKRGRFCGAKCKNTAGRIKHGDKFNNISRSKTPESFMKSLLNKKHRSDTLTIEYLKSLWDNQQGLCALTGERMTHQLGEGRIWTNISLDRIDPKGKYVEGNVQLVTRKANTMRMDLTLDEFFDVCEKALQHKNGKKV